MLALGAVVFLVVGTALERVAPSHSTDFKALYDSGRCLLQHCDPYNETQLQKVYLQEEEGRPTDSPRLQRAVTILVNLPTAFTFVIPFSLLPWGPAHMVWLILSGGSLILASLLVWDLGAGYAPRISGGLLAIFLATSGLLLATGNAAGIVVGVSVIAVWCFLRERFVPMGILCLAASLIIKPHDAGPVWLYFLLAGGVHRKRALQTLILAIALGLPGLLLAWHASPHWMTELHSNLLATSTLGDLNDPGPASVTGRDPDSMINLQTITSLFWDDPRIYNPLSYLVSGALVLIWAVTILRSRSSPARDLLALASIAALSMLMAYHRQHDAKILVLTFPANAMLWVEGGLAGWLALGFTAASILLNGDITSFIRFFLTKNLLAHSTGLTGKILVILLARPIPLILIVTGIFFLWAYARHAPTLPASTRRQGSAQDPTEPVLLEPGRLDRQSDQTSGGQIVDW